MGRPKGQNKKTAQSGSTGNRRITKKTKPHQGNSIGKILNAQLIEHNQKLGVNIFDQLNVKDLQNKQTTKQTSPDKNHRPPPIILTGKNNHIIKILEENGIESFNMKNMSIGTKLFVNNDDDFAKISSYLQQNNIDFYSHGRKEDKICKVVLSGLPEISTDTIKDELANLNIHPIQIVQMKTQHPNPHRALYLIHLNSKETTFQDMQKVKSIYHTIIKWSKYNPRSRGPTQCRNCSMYGHGTQNCHRKPICTLCASNEHNQMSCPLKALPKDSAPVFKCSYCTQNNIQPSNHRASDVNCPGRKFYLELRKPPSNQQQKQNQQQRKHNNINQYIPAPTPPPLTQSYRNVLSSSSEQQNQQFESNVNEDLFTTAELFKIFTNAIQDIKSCRTKLDQIQVIASLINHVLQ